MEKPEVMKVITEDAGGVTIATRHEWQKIREDKLNCLNTYAVVRSVISVNGIYQIMKDVDPVNYLNPEIRSAFILLKYTTDEETGKIVIMYVEIGAEEAKELITHADQFVWS